MVGSLLNHHQSQKRQPQLAWFPVKTDVMVSDTDTRWRCCWRSVAHVVLNYLYISLSVLCSCLLFMCQSVARAFAVGIILYNNRELVTKIIHEMDAWRMTMPMMMAMLW